jgi:hypothetical protein
VLALVFLLLVAAAVARARARLAVLRRVDRAPRRPAGFFVALHGWAEDVFGGETQARERRQEFERSQAAEEARRQRVAVAEAERLHREAEARARRYRRWWWRAVLAVVLAAAALGLAWGFLEVRGLVPAPVDGFLACFGVGATATRCQPPAERPLVRGARHLHGQNQSLIRTRTLRPNTS